LCASLVQIYPENPEAHSDAVDADACLLRRHQPGGRDVSKLFTPFASVVTAIIQKRFFHTGGDDDLAGVMLLCFAFVTRMRPNKPPKP
jgi:hypothetical protein